MTRAYMNAISFFNRILSKLSPVIISGHVGFRLVIYWPAFAAPEVIKFEKNLEVFCGAPAAASCAC